MHVKYIIIAFYLLAFMLIILAGLSIDISWVDYPYTRLLPVTSCIVDSAAIYIMGGGNLKYYIFDPLPRSSPFIGGQR
jgi:hypothetical protein